MVQELTPNEMLLANVNHLQFLESYSNNPIYSINGVDVIKALGYEMIQIMNHIWLKDKLAAIQLTNTVKSVSP